MYKPAKPIRCPSCGEIVQVDTSMILTSNPPQYKWECPKCGRTGTTSSKDIIAFENQKPMRTSGYIQKIDEPDLGVGVTTANATDDSYNTINAVPSIYSPKCREAVVKLRGTADSTANTMPENKSAVTAHKTTECNIPAPQFIQQGWECPRCGAILAPYMPYCPFCSKKESDWITTVGTGTQPFYGEWTQKDNLTPPSGQYTNPNPSITVSSGDILKVADSCTHTSATPCNNLKATL